MSQAAVIRWHKGGEAPLLDDAEYVHENNALDVVDENACLCPDSECGRRERPIGDEGSLGDLYRSVKINRGEGRSFLSRLYDFAGPGALVAVGYMDPGNWATDLAAGSAYNYSLLFVILFSSILAMFLQELSLRLGHAARLDLAQACKQHFSRPVSIFMWITAEIAIAACDLAEVVGSAIAMKLLFGIPLMWGVAITACDVLLLIAWGGKSMRCVEITILVFMLVIFTCFVIEIWFAQPDVWSMLRGVVTPPSHLFSDQKMLLISVGILGATVMPHNLYLHSSIVQSRDVGLDRGSVQSAIFFSTIDSNLALSFSFFVNASIIILAAATFYRSGHTEVTDIDQAYIMMSSLLGKEASSTLFAVALLASGQQSTITGTLAGQIVMEGFVEWSIAPWKRRLLTRIVAIAPAVAVVSLFGDRGVTALLVRAPYLCPCFY